jgi:hypothetical protein
LRECEQSCVFKASKIKESRGCDVFILPFLFKRPGTVRRYWNIYINLSSKPQVSHITGRNN